MHPSVWSRRQFVATAGVIAAVSAAWRGSGNPRKGRLTVRPHPPTSSETTTGFGRLGQGNGKDGLVYVPAGYHPERPAPLMLSLHGARGGSRGAVAPLVALADQHGWILVAPDSRQRTWDVVLGEFGPDVEWIDEALESVFRRYAIDPQLLAAEGFSDGGSYALSLGLVNGDLFTHVIAFSPGLVVAEERHGKPRVYLSHGTDDPVLPIDLCGRRIGRQLRRLGYDLEYHEFDGGHTVPPEIARQAAAWFRRV